MLRDSRITCVAPRFSRSRVVGSRRYFRFPTRWSALFQPPVGFILDRLYPLFGPRGPFQSGLLPFLTPEINVERVEHRVAWHFLTGTAAGRSRDGAPPYTLHDVCVVCGGDGAGNLAVAGRQQSARGFLSQLDIECVSFAEHGQDRLVG